MITYKIVPAHILRLYVWQILSEFELLSLVNGIVPIIPLEDEPEISDADATYIIYGYAENQPSDLEQIGEGLVAFRVIGSDSNVLTEIINVIGRAFESSDIATEAVNQFSTAYPGNALEGIRFTFVRTSFIENAEPSETEGGPVEGTITIEYRYINHLATPVPEGINGGLWT